MIGQLGKRASFFISFDLSTNRGPAVHLEYLAKFCQFDCYPSLFAGDFTRCVGCIFWSGGVGLGYGSELAGNDVLTNLSIG